MRILKAMRKKRQSKEKSYDVSGCGRKKVQETCECNEVEVEVESANSLVIHGGSDSCDVGEGGGDACAT